MHHIGLRAARRRRERQTNLPATSPAVACGLLLQQNLSLSHTHIQPQQKRRERWCHWGEEIFSIFGSNCFNIGCNRISSVPSFSPFFLVFHSLPFKNQPPLCRPSSFHANKKCPTENWLPSPATHLRCTGGENCISSNEIR